MYSHRLLKQISLIFVFKRGGPGSIPIQPMRDSWWTKWHCDRFSLEYFCFTLSASFPQNSILNFIYVLLWPEEQTGEAWELSKKLSFFFENGGAWDIKLDILLLFPSLKCYKQENHSFVPFRTSAVIDRLRHWDTLFYHETILIPKVTSFQIITIELRYTK